jgi:hypothetical protein
LRGYKLLDLIHKSSGYEVRVTNHSLSPGANGADVGDNG